MVRFCILLLIPLLADAVVAPRLRIPAGVKPLAYAIDLTITPGADEFTGRASIEIEAAAETAVVWLHARELTLTAARAGGEAWQAQQADNDFLAIIPPHPLAPGRTTLVLEYSGKISRTLTDGVFQQHENQDWYVFTKFEPVTARRAFPCFDEPSFKATWELTLHIPAHLQAYSNTPAAEESTNTSGKTIRFARTKPLPSYLIAFAVGPFETVSVPPLGRNRAPGRIIVPRGRSKEAAAAAAVTPKVVELLEDYFGIPYPFEKLDQIVIPLTTSWGAMENAGLIAYNQVLLAKPDENPDAPIVRSRLAVMLHETAHQWFGDYTTPLWWDDIWLNEGFASWLGPKLLDRWHPEWKVRDGGSGFVMAADSLVSARRVRQPIEAPGDIANAFDGITYSKGAAILRMVEDWLGEDTFRRGIRRFVADHRFAGATTADLIGALSRETGRDLNPVFASFLDQSGVPAVTAEVACDGARPVLRLSQERFLPVGSQGSTAAAWNVPVCYRWSDGASDQRECALLTTATASFPIASAGLCPAWFSLNTDSAGYYRYLYREPWFQRLLERGLDRLPPPERATLLQNTQALLTAGKFDVRSAMALAQRFIDAEDRETVAGALRIAGIVGQAAPDDMQPAFARFLREWVGPRARQLGWQPKTGEPLETRAIRLAIVPLAAIGGEDPELGRSARKLAEAWLRDRKSVDRESAPYTLITAARHGDRALFDLMTAELRKSSDQLDRAHLITALSAFPDPQLMQTALDLILDPGPGLDARELRGLITSQWRETRAVVWEFVKRRFDELNAKLPGARGIPYGATLPTAAGGFCEESRARDVEVFFQPRLARLSGGERNLARTVEGIRLCAARRAALESGACKFLEGRQAGPGAARPD